jgi:hypothetical protein
LQACPYIAVIGFFAESFQVHVGGVQIGMEHFQHLLGHIAIGHENVGQTLLVSQAGSIVGVFEKYGRFSVRIRDATAAGIQREVNNLFRWRFTASDQILFARHLGDLPVLAPLAAEIAAWRGNGISE